MNTTLNPQNSFLSSKTHRRPQAGREILARHVNILPTFRRKSPNSQHQHFGRAVSTVSGNLTACTCIIIGFGTGRLQWQLGHETRIWSSRSPPRSAIAQTARHPSVDITDTTPAHTAAALRPDRHHTHGLHTTISGWRLHEPHTLQSFCMNSSCPGRSLSANYSLVHAPYMSPCTKLSGVAWQGPQQEEFTQKANGLVCATRRHQRVKAVERPARARDVWRRGVHG